MFSAMSIVVDREFGFMREILVSPIPRVSIALGKILSGTTITTIQGLLMMVFLPLVGIDLTPRLFWLVPFIFLFGLVVSGIGVFVAGRMKSSENFQMVMQFLTFPMFMLSGAFFPLRGAPTWLEIISYFNPATYGVDMVRQIAFKIFEIPSAVAGGFSIEVFGNTVSVLGDVIVLIALGVVTVSIATWEFTRQD